MRSRLSIAVLLLLPLVVLTSVLVATVTFRGALSVDNRTYVEMATGVRAHGLPYTYNAYADLYPEARPAFNVLRDGKLWGNYTPLYPYVAALALSLGELGGIGKQSFVLIGMTALVVFGLGWRLSGDPLRGVAASYLTAFASPLWASSIETLALPLLYFWVAVAALLSLLAVDTTRFRTYLLSLGAGVAAGLGIATHLLAFPMGVFSVLGLAWVRGREQPSCKAERAVDLLPDRIGIGRAACAAVGLALPLVPMSLLNVMRFGSRNPISYGPCEWATCVNTDNALHTSGLMAFAAPAIPYFLAVGLGLVLARRNRWAMVVVGLGAVVVLLPPTALRTTVLAIGRTLYGYVVDVTGYDFPEFFDSFPDGFGESRGEVLVKSLLQSSPFLACAALSGFTRSGRGGRATLLLFPVLGLFAALALLARFPGAYAFGWPYVFFRYALPAVPLLAVLAANALGELEWRPVHWAFGLAVATVCLVSFLPSLSDAPMVRRVVLLRVTLASAAVTVGFALLDRWRPRAAYMHLARFGAAAAVALSVGVSMGVDTRILATIAKSLDTRVEKLARLTPFRFAVVGYGPVSDHVLTLRAERDINYIDLVEAPKGSWDNFRELVDRWADDGRPIFGVFPNDVKQKFVWPYADWDVPAVQLDEDEEFWKIGPPKRRVLR